MSTSCASDSTEGQVLRLLGVPFRYEDLKQQLLAAQNLAEQEGDQQELARAAAAVARLTFPSSPAVHTASRPTAQVIASHLLVNWPACRPFHRHTQWSVMPHGLLACALAVCVEAPAWAAHCLPCASRRCCRDLCSLKLLISGFSDICCPNHFSIH